MSLGLYVSSFYFFQSGKNSCYLGLNSPVQYNDTQYSQAIDFFEAFFAVRRTMETLESEKKLYYIILKQTLIGAEKPTNSLTLLLAYIREIMG